MTLPDVLKRIRKPAGPRLQRRLADDLFPDAHVDPTVDSDRRYTTRDTLHMCRRLARVPYFDLDVAADDEAHVAPAYLTIQDNALLQKWLGRFIWCNPPFSDLGPWLAKAWAEWWGSHPIERIAMLLPANRTEQRWWHEHVEPHLRAPSPLKAFFLPGRIKFGHPGNREGVGAGSPPFGCVLLVWGLE